MIFAIDFNCVPWIWAKTKEFGTSLMDIGVVYVMFGTGFSRIWERMLTFGSFSSWIKWAALKSLIIIVVGVLRLLCFWYFDYHTHVDEYGVHWNFFTTIALTEFIL